MSKSYYLGVDVGSSSVRVAVISNPTSDSNKIVVAHSSHPIKIFNPTQDFYEQSSDNIWLDLFLTEFYAHIIIIGNHYVLLHAKHSQRQILVVKTLKGLE